MELARKKAEAAGVKSIFIEDVREEFVRDYVFPMFRYRPRPSSLLITWCCPCACRSGHIRWNMFAVIMCASGRKGLSVPPHHSLEEHVHASLWLTTGRQGWTKGFMTSLAKIRTCGDVHMYPKSYVVPYHTCLEATKLSSTTQQVHVLVHVWFCHESNLDNPAGRGTGPTPCMRECTCWAPPSRGPSLPSVR